MLLSLQRVQFALRMFILAMHLGSSPMRLGCDIMVFGSCGV